MIPRRLNRLNRMFLEKCVVHLKVTTDASNCWLADRLGIGSPACVNKHVGLLQGRVGTGRSWLEELANTMGTICLPGLPFIEHRINEPI